jgi:hypothetical protein
MSNERIIIRKRDGDTTMLRGGICWVKITKVYRGRYMVVFGWKDQFTAIPGRTIYVSTLTHAVISGEGWIKDYGW